jgi:demethylmenaquinone methyltransferase/2-methoxy-6-polyprenyl-1,4-benzoquinol methylase
MNSKIQTPELLTGSDRAMYIKRLFARIAPHYDLANRFISGGMHRSWRRATLRKAFSLLQPTSMDVCVKGLDLCCGTGDYTFLALEEIGVQTQLVGLDFCEPMLHKAEKRRRKMGGSNAIAWVQCDATDLSVFRDASFDFITVGFGLRNVIDLAAVYRESARVLRPGGYFISLELTSPRGAVMKSLVFFYLRWLLPILAYMARGNQEDYLWLRRSLETFPEASSLSKMLISVGFAEPSVMRFGFGVVVGHVAQRVHP